MLKMFLASSFKDVVGLFRKFADEDLKGKTLTFIPTASIPEEVVHYVDTAKEEFKKLGVVLEELDVAVASPEEIKEKLERNDLIYVSGGNTFFLLQELRRSGTDKIIKEQVDSGKLYIGESAGAIVTSPNIEYIRFMDDKEKATQLKTFEGLNLVEFYPVPHYSNEPFKDSTSAIIAHYDSALNLLPISNTQVIKVKENDVIVCE
ncbi:Type 1 glutamine amidotransferase-like domain-containing protein [Bacillus massiliigorillae]|uniref:Type 1 glutamine amidotransferase-like domain-containing protein n=1 Tax=Bacillus massiliigorillae TaxID=1243664 RepID=UPI0003A920B1|nr:Type 1 glutamine amidotransferase-like domain-containing protein [Bacillus massiliigorillae]